MPESPGHIANSRLHKRVILSREDDEGSHESEVNNR
jgi:hypothetical protein